MWNIWMGLGGNRAKGHLPAGRAGLVSWAEPEEKKKAFGPQRAKDMTEEKVPRGTLKGALQEIGQKAPSLPDRPGWFLRPSRRKRKKAFGPQRAKGMTDEKSSTWNIEGYFAGNWTKGPLPARQAGLVSWAEPDEKKKPLVCCEPKAIPKKEKVPRGTLKGTLQELDKRPPPCQTGRADCFGRAEGKRN